MLGRPDVAVRAEAARGLGYVGTSSSLPALVEIAAKSWGRDRSVAESAIASIRARIPEAEEGQLSVVSNQRAGALSTCEDPRTGALSTCEDPRGAVSVSACVRADVSASAAVSGE